MSVLTYITADTANTPRAGAVGAYFSCIHTRLKGQAAQFSVRASQNTACICISHSYYRRGIKTTLKGDIHAMSTLLQANDTARHRASYPCAVHTIFKQVGTRSVFVYVAQNTDKSTDALPVIRGVVNCAEILKSVNVHIEYST